MRPGRARNVLLAAFAISLILHLFLAGYIRWPAILRPNEEAQIVKVRVISVARIKPHTPAPTPPPTPVPTPAVRSSVAPPSVAKSSKGPPTAAHVAGPGTHVHTPPPPPSPSPTVAVTASPSSCMHNTTDPSVSATPDVGDISGAVRAAKISGTAAIQVWLDPQGHVTNAAVAQSTGSTGLDNVAIQMARNATYIPKMVDCKAVASTYTFTVKFVAW